MALEPIVVSGCLSGRALKNKSQATKYFKSRCYFNFFFFFMRKTLIDIFLVKFRDLDSVKEST